MGKNIAIIEDNTIQSQIIEEENNDQEIFAKGLSFFKLFIIFVFGCVFGTIWEEVLVFIIEHKWITQQGMVYGPFNPIYGTAAAGLTWLLKKKDREWYVNFILGALVAGFFEYLMHELEMKFTGSVSWNYIDLPLAVPSIVSRGATAGTTVFHIFFWGLLSLLMADIIYPVLSKEIERIPPKAGKIICSLFLIFLIYDFIITGLVMIRHGMRQKGEEPYTAIGQYIDRKYPDEFVYKVFPDKDPDNKK